MANELPIHFLDLGAGQNPDRIKALAKQHPSRRFVGVDAKPLGDHEQLAPNLTYVESDVVEYLKRLEPGTVRLANADFLLNELPDPKIHELIEHVHRALAVNGRFYLSEDVQNIPEFLEILRRHGFRAYARKITAQEARSPRTWFTEERIRHPTRWVDSRKGVRVSWPVRIVAVKRPCRPG